MVPNVQTVGVDSEMMNQQWKWPPSTHCLSDGSNSDPWGQFCIEFQKYDMIWWSKNEPNEIGWMTATYENVHFGGISVFTQIKLIAVTRSRKQVVAAVGTHEIVVGVNGRWCHWRCSRICCRCCGSWTCSSRICSWCFGSWICSIWFFCRCCRMWVWKAIITVGPNVSSLVL